MTHSFKNLMMVLSLAMQMSLCSYGQETSRAEPAEVGTLTDQANGLFENKEYDKALLVYQKVLDLEPDNFDALYKSGWMENEKEQFAVALSFLERAKQARPDEPKTYIDIGFSNARMQRADEAIAAYTEASKRNDFSFHAWQGLGDAYYDLKQDYPAALKAYLRADYHRRDEATVNFRIGMCYEKAQAYGSAEMYFRRVADRVLGFLPAQTELGYCYLKLNEFDSARDRYERALKINPKNVQSHFFLGRAWIGLRALDKAEQEAKVLDNLSPSLATALRKNIDTAPRESVIRMQP